MIDVTYLEYAWLGLGGGMLLSGVCWLIGLLYALALNLIMKNH